MCQRIKSQDLIEAKKNKRRKFLFEVTDELPIGEGAVPSPPPLPTVECYVYSDDKEDEMFMHAFTVLDSMKESRRGLDADDVDATTHDEIPDPSTEGQAHQDPVCT